MFRLISVGGSLEEGGGQEDVGGFVVLCGLGWVGFSWRRLLGFCKPTAIGLLVG